MALSTSSKEKYKNTSQYRPDEFEVVGSGHYCYIPGCKTSTLDKNKSKSHIGIFSFPSDPTTRKYWENVISQLRRKWKNDRHDPRKRSTKVCEFHFAIEDSKCSHSGIKSLRAGAVPKIFKFKTPKVEKRRKSLRKRESYSERMLKADAQGDVSDEDKGQLIDDDIQMNYIPQHSSCISEKITKNEIKYLREENDRLKNDNIEVTTEVLFVKEEYSNLKGKTYNYQNVSENPEMFKSATGLDFMAFDELYDFLKPGGDFSNLKFYDSTGVSDKADNRNPENDEIKTAKPGPILKMPPKEHLFLLLSWLRNGSTLRHAAWLFDTPKSTLSRFKSGTIAERRQYNG